MTPILSARARCACGASDGGDCPDCPDCPSTGCYAWTDPLVDDANWTTEVNVSTLVVAGGEMTFDSTAAGDWSVQTSTHPVVGLIGGETYTVRFQAWKPGTARHVEFAIVEFDAGDNFVGVQSPLGNVAVATSAPGTLVEAAVVLDAATTSIRLVLKGKGATAAGETVHVRDLFVNFGDDDGTPDSACPACPACSCAGTYIPYCLGPENAVDADALILGTTPFAYYPLDISRTPTDITGNGHNAITGIGTTAYVGPITSKNVGALQLTNGGGIRFPPPVADMSNPGTAWSLAMVMQVDAYNSGAGGSTALDGGFPFLSWCGSSPPKMAHCIGSTGRLVGWMDSNFTRSFGNVCVSNDVLFAIGEPHVLVVRAALQLGANIAAATEFWLDGVLVLVITRYGDGTDGTVFDVGRIEGGGPFFGAVDMTFSNLATWARALTTAEIAAISAALVDDAILANSWVPA